MDIFLLYPFPALLHEYLSGWTRDVREGTRGALKQQMLSD